MKNKVKVAPRNPDHMIRVSHLAYTMLQGMAVSILEDMNAHPELYPLHEGKKPSLSDVIKIICLKFKESLS